jgi:uncharacterized membrane-anchored protein
MNDQNKSTSKEIFNKVPQVTLFFWIIKVLCTTVGETFADFLNVNLGFGLTGTSITMGLLLAIALFFQFKSKKYIPAIYWISVVFISVFGTLITDNLTDVLGIRLETSTIIFSILVLSTFVIWYFYEKTLSIHSILTHRRESFYWTTILFTFALGTASGDLIAEGLGLGYLNTGIIVAITITLIVMAQKLKLNSVLSFWLIYIMTRPLGASIGDYLSQPYKYGGLGLGATLTSIIFLVGILAIIIYFTLTKRDEIEYSNTLEQQNKEDKGLVLQSLITVALFIAVGSWGYSWRQNALKIEDAPAQTTSNSINQQTPLSKLGDLTAFTKIAADIKELETANNTNDAIARVADLEHDWDVAQAKLKPLDKGKWTEVDDAIDKVIREFRAVNPNHQGCLLAVDDLLQVLS